MKRKFGRLIITLLILVLIVVVLPIHAFAAASYDAYVVKFNIPDEMCAGYSYEVSVEMMNSGSMVWTKDSFFRLGAVGDQDYFAGTRQTMSDEVVIYPGQSYTFKFIMTAPKGPGMYTTDWKMVRESVAWFGGMVQKQVKVIGPGTNIALGKYTTASTPTWSDETPDKAVNGVYLGLSNKWCTGFGLGNNSWIKVDLGAEYFINRWKVVHSKYNSINTYHYDNNQATRDFRIQISQNGIDNWNDLDKVLNNTSAVTDRIIPAVKARYLRLYIDIADFDNVARIQEWEIYTAPLNLAYQKPALASTTVNSGWYGPETPDKAVNCSFTGGWSDKWCTTYNGGNNSWIMVDLGSEVYANQYAVAHAKHDGESYYTQDFRIQGSKDGVNWTTLDTVTNNTDGFTIRDMGIFKGRYFRMYIDKADMDGAARIYEFQIFYEDLPVLGNIDTPSENQTITGIFGIQGWAMDDIGLSRVEVYLDTNYIGNAEISYYRPDVYHVFPKYRNWNSGFSYNLDARLLTGKHTVNIKAVSMNGTKVDIGSRTIDVPYQPMPGDILITYESTPDHSAIVYDAGHTVESAASTGGVKMKTVDVTSWRSHFVVYRVKGASIANGKTAADYAYSKIGYPYNYDFTDYKNTSKFYCNSLVWRSWNHAGWNLDNGVWAILEATDLAEDNDTYKVFEK